MSQDPTGQIYSPPHYRMMECIHRINYCCQLPFERKNYDCEKKLKEIVKMMLIAENDDDCGEDKRAEIVKIVFFQQWDKGGFFYKKSALYPFCIDCICVFIYGLKSEFKNHIVLNLINLISYCVICICVFVTVEGDKFGSSQSFNWLHPLGGTQAYPQHEQWPAVYVLSCLQRITLSHF